MQLIFAHMVYLFIDLCTSAMRYVIGYLITKTTNLNKRFVDTRRYSIRARLRVLNSVVQEGPRRTCIE